MTTASSSISPQQLADAVSKAMLAKDRVAQDLNIQLLSVGAGSATMTMTVQERMLNGFAICHGGYITILADTAFAYACNSYNDVTVASSLGIEFIAAVQGGDVLTAVAKEVSLAGRTGLYDIEISNQDGKRVAVMRGRSYRLKNKKMIAI
ncbi:MAG: hydroxyphenylacetyl-CoA thioesterase PaaI [Burkholderiaceae bacterium]